MKNSTYYQLKGISLAIPVFVLFLISGSVYGQITTSNSNCFSITAVYKNQTTPICRDNTCGEGEAAHECDNCIIVTIKNDKCPGLNPTTFKITSGGDEICYSVCPGPSDDFTVTHGPYWHIYECSWYNPRVIVYNTAGGIPDNGTATFMICRPSTHSAPAFNIELPPGTTCGGTPCTAATVSF